MVTLKSIIIQTDFIEVWHCLKRHNRVRSKKSYRNFRNLYKKLQKTETNDNPSNTYIYINAFKTDEDGEPHCIEDFNQDATSLYYDVSGRVNGQWGYSLVATKYENWVSFFILEDTLEKFSNPNIICHCLWEMSFFGFNPKWDKDGSMII